MTGLLALLIAIAPDTLRLGPGVHPGPLVITRPMVVLGAPGAVLRGSGRGSVLDISAPGTVVRGLRIEHSGRNSDQDDAGVMVRADSVALEDLVIRDVLFGVYLRKVRDVRLRNLDIQGPRGLPESQMGDGIHFYNSTHVMAEGNRIQFVRDGMFFSYSDSVLVTGNAVSHVRFGLHYMNSHYNRFEQNTFTNNAAGAVIMFSNGLVVRDNVFAWNSGSRAYGLILQTSGASQVEGNLFVGNGVGVFFDNAVRGRFTGNLVAGNWLGFKLFTNSEAMRVTGNAVIANTFDAAGGAANGAYLFCVEGKGNYWSASVDTGFDLDGDGVMDAPYAASSPLAELARDREGLRLFLVSPAARSLDWAERTFPVFQMTQVTDECPAAKPPRIATIGRLPSAPKGQTGGTTGQVVAGGAIAAAGLGLLFSPRRWRYGTDTEREK